VFDGDSEESGPLDSIEDADAQFGSYRKLTASNEFRFVRQQK